MVLALCNSLDRQLSIIEKKIINISYGFGAMLRTKILNVNKQGLRIKKIKKGRVGGG